MRARGLLSLVAVVATIMLGAFASGKPVAFADPVSGAIFTTNANDTEVNVNQYASKTDVYLNGGPGLGAPVGAAGLPPGVYVFQVTDPSGKNLLSTDPAKCRQFTVGTAGFMIDVAPSVAAGCGHVTGSDSVTKGITVQLMPFNDTTNNGGVYKAWATPVGDYVCSLNVVDCGSINGGVHGFIHSDSKTDNFKVKNEPVREIDTTFHDNATGALLMGMSETWTDTLGASNVKWTYDNANIGLYHQAHVESVEPGTHLITISNQSGCTVTEIDLNSKVVATGPGTVAVTIPNTNNKTAMSWYIDVYCN